MKMIWTRSERDWDLDQPLWTKTAEHLLRLPCIHTVIRPLTRPKGAVDALVFTSRNGVLAAHTEDPALLTAAPSLTHGAATANELAQRGAAVERVDVRTAEELAAQLATRWAGSRKTVWIVGPTRPAYDIAAHLAEEGHAATHLAAYETIAEVASEGGPLTPALRMQILPQLRGVIGFASPSAVESFVHAFGQAGTDRPADLAAVCLGPTTSKAARAHFSEVKTCETSTTEVLAKTMQTLWQEKQDS